MTNMISAPRGRTRVLGRLLFERRISDRELRGLNEDKRNAIRSCARVLSELAA